ncbi:uncharacterized protein MELLADRAFT_112575 [Melampsora larici-populina 98AG31]|uniref:Uncharacterized protein n=1 Tax=Melampsora larici-populina (strain 98AG31 / pathotype 3-4-7) TaxID=747676 RepID=F4S6X6_MELLP|nr:uncharacterized protein MELLADRAFT_112575 [Melampsora larici-populina 98AG31]EGF99534.1 hypothetical protein MELLADRAFT_112575 [Melampsora larici-populina 98AG31]
MSSSSTQDSSNPSISSRPPIWAQRLLSTREQDTTTAYEVTFTIKRSSRTAMGGMVIWADHYLLRHERFVRKTDDLMRRQAREDLGKRGIIATETELKKWKKDQLESLGVLQCLTKLLNDPDFEIFLLQKYNQPRIILEHHNG